MHLDTRQERLAVLLIICTTHTTLRSHLAQVASRFHSRVAFSRVASMETRAVDAMAGVDGAGAARRRRERRLRAYLRYARMSVAMALAECTHHSAPPEDG